MPNIKISELSSAAQLTGNEVLPIVQNNATVKTTTQSVANLLGINFTPENVANKSVDTTLSANSDTLYPSQKAVKAYVDGTIVSAVKDNGNWDASGNLFPNVSSQGQPVKKGDLWFISVGGTLGGTAVLAGYSIRALIDNPGQNAANWGILNVGLGFTPENVANKSTDVTLSGNSDTLYPSQKAIKTYVDGKTGVNATLVNATSSGLYYNNTNPNDPKLYALYNTTVADNVTNAAVGSLAAGTPASTWKTRKIVEVLDAILFPLINPTYTNPSYSLSSNTAIAEIGASGVRPTLTGSFFEGRILIGSTTQNSRSGDATTYQFSGPSGFSTTVAGPGSGSGQNYTATSSYTSDLTITQGLITFSSTVNYAQGPQPKDSLGNNYQSGLPAGNLTSTTTLEGVYPIYATTSSLTVQTKQALVSMINGNNIVLTLVSESISSPSDKQKFWIPSTWISSRPLTSVQLRMPDNTYNPQNTISLYTVTDTTIGGVSYKQYTYNGATRGDVTIKLIF